MATELKDVACAAIDENVEKLFQLSTDIWNHPELGLEETYAHQRLTDALEMFGFEVTTSHVLPTAFKATYGDSNLSPHVAFFCEYDCLPGIGHACGHNLIAEVGVAAGIGVKAAMDAAQTPFGRLTVFGSPAEETTGGKIDIIQNGDLSDVDFSMMCHPSAISDPSPVYLACQVFRVLYHGKAVHATCDPWEGINALDAAVMCYQAISNLRLHFKNTWKVNVIIRRGGEMTNIIPDETEIEISIRAPTNAEFALVKQKVVSCCEAAAIGTGCTVTYEDVERMFQPLVSNTVLVDLYEKNQSCLPVDPQGPSQKSRLDGSSDMGNVTNVVPGIHPHFYIGGVEVYHTKGFTKDSGSQVAQKYTLRQAKAIAMTAIDVMLNPSLQAKMKAEFVIQKS